MTTLKARIGAYLIPRLPVSRRSFDVLRYELRALRTRARNRLDPRFRAAVGALRARRDLSVNIGSGGRGLPGWVNIEMIPMRDTTLCLDIRRPLPLADGSAARILAEHVLEHLDFRHDVPGVLRDWHRVLRPGGVARIVVPDARRFLEAYVSGDPGRWRDLGWDVDALPGDIHTPMHVVNHIFHQSGEHCFAYDFATLEWALRAAGFAGVHRTAFRSSLDGELAIDQDNHAPYSLYVDAVR